MIKTAKGYIGQDGLKLIVTIIGCIILGFLVNELRSRPLALAYLSPAARLDEAVKEMGTAEYPLSDAQHSIELEELKKLILQRTALILDARPAIFYRLSHIPSAVSLPRDDFKDRYLALNVTLQEYQHKRIIVYCASSGCQDSEMVAVALRKLGFSGVQVFRGGWSQWTESGLPEEAK